MNSLSATLPTRGEKRQSGICSSAFNSANKWKDSIEFCTLPLPPSHFQRKHQTQRRQALQSLNLNTSDHYQQHQNSKKESVISFLATDYQPKPQLPTSTLPIHKKRENYKSFNNCKKSFASPVVPSRNYNVNLFISKKGGKEQNGVKSTNISVNNVRSKVSDSIVDRSDKRINKSLPLRNGALSEEQLPYFINGNIKSSPSTDSNDSSLPMTFKKLETSTSVPYSLSETAGTIRHSISTASMPSIAKGETIFPLGSTTANSSESMPNLTASPKHQSPVSPVCSSSISDSDITSEQSGWVSSHRSSPEASSGLISPAGKFL